MHRSMTHPAPLAVLFFCAAIFVCTTGSTQVINEYPANHTGTDDHEYIEVFGEPNTSYANLTIIQIEGDVGDRNFLSPTSKVLRPSDLVPVARAT